MIAVAKNILFIFTISISCTGPVGDGQPPDAQGDVRALGNQPVTPRALQIVPLSMKRWSAFMGFDCFRSLKIQLWDVVGANRDELLEI